jgi:hypothetical protein
MRAAGVAEGGRAAGEGGGGDPAGGGPVSRGRRVRAAAAGQITAPLRQTPSRTDTVSDVIHAAAERPGVARRSYPQAAQGGRKRGHPGHPDLDFTR